MAKTMGTARPKKEARSEESRGQERQGLLLLALLALGEGGAAQKDLTVTADPAVRGPLERAGLIRTSRRGRGNWLEMTDKGWDEAGRRLGTLLPAGGEGASAVLRAWLVRLSAFMTARDVALADLLAPPAEAPSQPVAADGPEMAVPAPGDLSARIRTAYLAVTGGHLNTRALLKDLRPRLADVPAAALDAALAQMQRAGAARLYRIDNRIEITEADRAAAIQIAGEPRHILWIEQ